MRKLHLTGIPVLRLQPFHPLLKDPCQFITDIADLRTAAGRIPDLPVLRPDMGQPFRELPFFGFRPAVIQKHQLQVRITVRGGKVQCQRAHQREGSVFLLSAHKGAQRMLFQIKKNRDIIKCLIVFPDPFRL